MKSYTAGAYEMRSASGEAEKNVYKKFIGKSGKVWLVKVGKFPADNIYVDGGKGSEGFGGRTLTFDLEDGSKIDLIGPWHSNSGALFHDTGYDIQNKHQTFVVIAKTREYKKGQYNATYSDILFIDDEAQESEFNRGDDMAQKMANELKAPVYYHVQTGGGSHSGTKEPKNEN